MHEMRGPADLLHEELVVQHVSPHELEVGMVGERVPPSVSRCRLSIATISFSSTSWRASVVPMKPAPPVITMRLPVSGTRRVYGGRQRIRATLGSCDRCVIMALALGALVVSPRPRLGQSAERRSGSPTGRTARNLGRNGSGRCAAAPHGDRSRSRVGRARDSRTGVQAVRAADQEHRLHGDLRRNAGRTNRGHDRRQGAVGDGVADEWVRDRPLERARSVASAAGRHFLTPAQR